MDPVKMAGLHQRGIRNDDLDANVRLLLLSPAAATATQKCTEVDVPK
jgi:hypothetical protein